MSEPQSSSTARSFAQRMVQDGSIPFYVLQLVTVILVAAAYWSWQHPARPFVGFLAPAAIATSSLANVVRMARTGRDEDWRLIAALADAQAGLWIVVLLMLGTIISML